MYFTSGSDRAFEQLMQGKPGRRIAAPAAFIARTGNINSASMRNVPTSRAS